MNLPRDVPFYNYDAHIPWSAYVIVMAQLVQKNRTFLYFLEQNKCHVMRMAILNYITLEVEGMFR